MKQVTHNQRKEDASCQCEARERKSPSVSQLVLLLSVIGQSKVWRENQCKPRQSSIFLTAALKMR